MVAFTTPAIPVHPSSITEQTLLPISISCTKSLCVPTITSFPSSCLSNLASSCITTSKHHQFTAKVSFNPQGNYDLSLLNDDDLQAKAPEPMPPKEGRYEIIIDTDAIRRLDLSPFQSATGISSSSSGARLGKFAIKSASSQLTNLAENENALKKSDGDINIVDKKEISIEVNCKDDEDHCSSKGKYRKLITSTTIPTSSAKPIQENLDKGGKKMDKTQTLSSSIHRDPPTAFDVDKHKEIAPTEYENAMDMTVMDYSPAKRKPPIHN